MTRASRFALASSFVLTVLPLTAYADGSSAVSVVSAQFTDKVTASKPVGDASSLNGAATATYWLDMSNSAKETATITLVWTVDGKEAAKQTLDIGHSPHWRTWASCPIKNAHAVEVKVTDADGNALKTDTLTLS